MTDSFTIEYTLQYPENYKCLYCGGDCPKDEDHACDGYLGDIDNLYSSEDE